MIRSLPMPDVTVPLKIGTRGSPLAVAQAVETRNLLMAAHGLPEDRFEIVVISTTADRVQDRALKEIGGKGLFTKEIEEALLAGAIDLAVHCVKDMAVEEPAGLISDCHLEREDPRDVFLSTGWATLADLPEGAVLGTSSMRRRAQALHLRPDLQVVNFRGNVQTRLRKLGEGVAAATFLALAGLNRLGMREHAKTIISADEMLPAVGQGALVIQRRREDALAETLTAPLHHRTTEVQIACERTFLATLEGSCETPIAGLAEFEGDLLRFRGEILTPDGSGRLTVETRGAPADAAEMGEAMARDLLSRAPADFFDWRRPVQA
ncbi:hydroxymethylbilane synthase [Haematobacter massiliensis]|uniref:Porphobilinogen deaminase n=2 Tax=Haematobacter massiliensis TaxID=195105 RepID=A0A086Y517_9RHOB|nr:porphobilinogen deaminase [Haematobacter massiliensis]OWJ71236.1 hydroxymethylbilane synthase [Haematobacter massiliensis]OWJ84318.1 hydroxymethylbilane synthase [Haematobacter massiliensis]QBJ25986.1 hydroxymethylbilane synthase [Haematobacter massiliensis]